MKLSWETKKLGDVCELLKRGIAPKYVDEGGICVINQKCIRDHSINFVPSRRHNIEVKTVNPERYVRIGDVLVNSTGTGTLGRVAQVRSVPEEPTTVDTHVTIIRPIDGMFHQDFFGYMLIKIEDEIASSGEGASGQTELARTTLENKFNVSFPRSLPEQKRIVAILDEAFEAITTAVTNAEKNLANARELFESYLNSVFDRKGEGWIEMKLSEAVKSVSTGPFGSMLHKSDYIENGVPIVNPINIVEDCIRPSDSKTVSKETAARLNTYVLDVDDIVIGRRGEIGRCAVVEVGQAGWLCGTGCFYIKPSSALNSYFLSSLLRSAQYREELEKVATGATMKNLSNTSLSNLVIAFPVSTDYQDDIVSGIEKLSDEIRHLETIYQQKLTALAELKQSILQKAFAGELTEDVSSVKVERVDAERPVRRSHAGAWER